MAVPLHPDSKGSWCCTWPHECRFLVFLNANELVSAFFPFFFLLFFPHYFLFESFPLSWERRCCGYSVVMWCWILLLFFFFLLLLWFLLSFLCQVKWFEKCSVVFSVWALLFGCENHMVPVGVRGEVLDAAVALKTGCVCVLFFVCLFPQRQRSFIFPCSLYLAALFPPMCILRAPCLLPPWDAPMPLKLIQMTMLHLLSSVVLYVCRLVS